METSLSRECELARRIAATLWRLFGLDPQDRRRSGFFTALHTRGRAHPGVNDLPSAASSRASPLRSDARDDASVIEARFACKGNIRGVRHASMPLLATRRHYERLYTIIKKHQPVDGWLRIHDWGPIMPVAAFCDENWVGEGLIGPIASTPEKNYYPVVDLAYARTALGSANWGHLTNWLTELGVYAGTDPIKCTEWYGKMVKPPTDGQRGEWIIPRMKDYEHVAGLVLASDIWNFGGNDLGITKLLLDQMFKDIGMDDSVRFIGHWEMTDELAIDGGQPEKIVCSIYFKPATDTQGNAQSSWLMLVPFNNTDTDVKLHLKPNLAKFGLASAMNGQLRDVYKAVGYTYEGTFKINPNDAEMPHFQFRGVEERFDLKNGEATIDMPHRSFKALLLESTR